LGIGGSSIGAHIEDNVLQRSCLGNLPVNSCSYSDGHSRGIDDEVANLAEEVVLIGIPPEM
jgi:hypothetical protein